MEIYCNSFGVYQTNCYILKTKSGEIIIDPGDGAFEWIQTAVSHPLAIINTHGHFDHVWDNQKTKEAYMIPLYSPKEDIFMLTHSSFATLPPSYADIAYTDTQTAQIGDTTVQFRHFPGHTPGCSVVIIDDLLFSGDFIFNGSIGRSDFPYSSPADMKKSLERFLAIEENYTIYPGHGKSTSSEAERPHIRQWLTYFD